MSIQINKEIIDEYDRTHLRRWCDEYVYGNHYDMIIAYINVRVAEGDLVEDITNEGWPTIHRQACNYFGVDW